LCDQSHFCRVFRRVTGVSPNVWRRAHCADPKSAGDRDDRYREVNAIQASGRAMA
jgi:AraC-like DNA-binding protein